MAGAGAAFLWDPKMPTFVPAGGFEAQAAAREEQRNEALEAAKAEFFEKQRRLRAVEARQAQTGEVSCCASNGTATAAGRPRAPQPGVCVRGVSGHRESR